MANKNEVSAEIIEDELYGAMDDLDEATRSRQYSDVSDMTEFLGDQTEKLVRENVLPEKGIISQVSTTDMVIDLALANIAKQTSVKLQKFETFLGEIEDRLFDQDSLKEMSKADLLTLYTSTRLMRTDAFKMLKEIRKDVDFSGLEASLLSMHSKESLKEDAAGGNQVHGLLEKIISDPNFIQKAQATQRKALEDDSIK